MNMQDVEKIFNDADRSKLAVFLHSDSTEAIPAVQILPVTNSPKSTIKPGTSCIKLYNCNQDICLVGIQGKKYATNELILSKLTKKEPNNSNCQQHSTVANTNKSSSAKTPAITVKSTAKLPAFSWVKVIQVKADDSLNIRKTTHYKSKKIGTLAFNDNCIKRLSCTGKWCKIQQQSITGWVHRKFITKMSATERTQCF
ncbi:MAG: hypothetical protein OFPII_17070 [Osedax symbiont Rs1]|nr:MAG: hypothetical protein OFPII_17070 [Osedax symbiont Rs1]